MKGEVKNGLSEEGRGLPWISQGLRDDLGQAREEKPVDRWISMCKALR